MTKIEKPAYEVTINDDGRAEGRWSIYLNDKRSAQGRVYTGLCFRDLRRAQRVQYQIGFALQAEGKLAKKGDD